MPTRPLKPEKQNTKRRRGSGANRKSRDSISRLITALCLGVGMLLLCVYGIGGCIYSENPPVIRPPAGETIQAEPPFSFAVIGDTRGNVVAFEKGVKRIKEMQMDLILHAGDIAQRLNTDQFNWVLEKLDEMDISVPFCPVPGNHDIIDSTDELRKRYHLYNRAFGPRRYWFSYGNACFVAFDNSTETITDESLSWLGDVLKAHREDYELCFVLCHVPPHTSGISHTLNEEDSDDLMRLLSKHRVDAVFTGHLHSYTQYEVHDVPVYSAGKLGEEKSPGKPHTFLAVDVTSDGNFSVEKQEVEQQVNTHYLEYLLRVKFPDHGLLIFGAALLLTGAVRCWNVIRA